MTEPLRKGDMRVLEPGFSASKSFFGARFWLGFFSGTCFGVGIFGLGFLAGVWLG